MLITHKVGILNGSPTGYLFFLFAECTLIIMKPERAVPRKEKCYEWIV